MKPHPRFAIIVPGLALFFALITACCLAAATLSVKIDPLQVNAGDQVAVTITVQNGSVADIRLPDANGLTLVGTRSTSNLTFANGNISRGTSYIFILSTAQPGDFTIPTFDVPTAEGETLHVKPIKIHVLGAAATPAAANALTTTPTPPVNPNGPVVMPSANASPAPAENQNPNDMSGSDVTAPRGPDGGPAKVFIHIVPATTNAYVGQSVILRIDFYIREDVNWQQNSLPTIKGSDFLMNNFTTFGRPSAGTLENMQYYRETWITSIAAPKSGDFPLSMERDTYWIKSISNSNINSLFGTMFGRQANLAHEMISSNLVTMHVQPLPEEGRPEHFTGAIGQFRVTGEAEPDTVAMGEPVTLRFTVAGDGNFDYVRCPALPDDPEWKAYVPRSGTNYVEESHTRAVKTFEQSVIPRKNGNVPLPTATFSYFDPTARQYVTVPIALPDIVVTGTPPLAAAPEGSIDSTSLPVAPKTAEFHPNRLFIGSTQMSLDPIYHHPWFWAVQTALMSLPVIAALLLFIRPHSLRDNGVAEREFRLRSVRLEEDSMAAAVRQADPLAFFIAARHAIQLQLGTQWSESPEAITLGEIHRRDPQLAERLRSFFAQADEVIYSGRPASGLDLAEWEQRVRTELLQPQPA